MWRFNIHKSLQAPSGDILRLSLRGPCRSVRASSAAYLKSKSMGEDVRRHLLEDHREGRAQSSRSYQPGEQAK